MNGQQLEKALNQYYYLFENSPVGLVTTNTAGVVTDANLTFIKMSGLKREDFIGQEFASLLEKSCRKPFKNFLARITDTKKNDKLRSALIGFLDLEIIVMPLIDEIPTVPSL